MGLDSSKNHQLNLFENENPKHKYLMKTIDFIQKKEGQSKIKLASQDLRKRWKMKQENLSPNYTCKLNEILVFTKMKKKRILFKARKRKSNFTMVN